jgi:uncharacterized alkaline shock family protein YloU
MTKEKAPQEGKGDAFSVPMISDDFACNMGEIKINHSVIANIATLSAIKTGGVLAVGKRGLANGIASLFSKKKTTGNGGVNVTEDEFGNYTIDVCVTLEFGCELTKIASDIQQSIARHVTQMTNTGVNKVNVIIDGVECPENLSNLYDNDVTEDEL